MKFVAKKLSVAACLSLPEGTQNKKWGHLVYVRQGRINRFFVKIGGLRSQGLGIPGKGQTIVPSKGSLITVSTKKSKFRF
jgi:hypothetical protein